MHRDKHKTMDAELRLQSNLAPWRQWLEFTFSFFAAKLAHLIVEKKRRYRSRPLFVNIELAAGYMNFPTRT